MSVQDPLTPRELFYAAKARKENEWSHTSCMLAMIHNILAKKPKGPDAFNPLRLAENTGHPNDEMTNPNDWGSRIALIRQMVKTNE